MRFVDVTTDIAFKKVFGNGLKEGLERGVEEGVERGKVEVARKMKAAGIGVEVIERTTGLSREKITGIWEVPDA